MIHIRAYQVKDLVPMTELMFDLGYPTSVDSMKNRMSIIENLTEYATYVAEIAEKVVGMIGIRQIYSYEEDGFVTQISLLVTKKEYEGRGIGTALVRFAEEWAKERHSPMLYLTSGIKPERVRAHEFYKTLGFETSGYRFTKKLK
ncbi:GNAT family N-acetyltransferase [Paenibacillus alkaliterrae]|uniref:GNAT family N-acetyltransferase n=1 Tax=Paenibacillus alkaliterrae TaxID=320909 RepID=UPI001F224790|nr:GNAT family N-acetyltransferase [Paenibacillus alkaliterrae]MCF2937164.1 GNAT family N-acetyltransferase [Paenibacillus alkaliterrae]